jgi:NAD-specific glutamate dehydrogenase
VAGPKGIAMPTIPSRDRSEIIDEIRRYAQERLTPEQKRLFQMFVGQYCRHVARGDLAARHVHDRYGAAMSHLILALDRPPGAPAVRVYSPDFEAHRFDSPQTVVAIVTDDMPFVVDSVTEEVIRQGNRAAVALLCVGRHRRGLRNRPRTGGSGRCPLPSRSAPAAGLAARAQPGLPRDDRWQALARAALRDDLYAVPGLAGRRGSAGWCPAQDSDELIQRGFARNRPAVGRCLGVLRDIAADDRSDLATLSVALREVRGLVSSRPGVAKVLSCSRRRVASSGDQRAGETLLPAACSGGAADRIGSGLQPGRCHDDSTAPRTR